MMNQQALNPFRLNAIAFTIALIGFQFAATSHAQRTPSEGLRGWTRAQRIELAGRLSPEAKQDAASDLSSNARKNLPPHLAMMDPAWTAKFILENPVDGDANLAWDNRVIRTLLTKVEELDDETVLKLATTSEVFNFLRFNYVRVALETIESQQLDRPKLKRRLIQLAKEVEPSSNFSLLVSRYRFAESIEDDAFEAQCRQDIEQFYTSGKAEKYWKQITDPKRDSAADYTYIKLQLHFFAPEKMKSEFAGAAKGTQLATDLPYLLQVHTTSKKEVERELNQITRYQFSTRPHELVNDVWLLSILAKYNLDRAREFAANIPNPVHKAWCDLLIAPTLAVSQPEAAKASIKSAYRQLAGIDFDQQHYNVSPALVAAKGLAIVNRVAPEELPGCIDVLEDRIQQMTGSFVSTALEHQFQAIVLMAQFDRARAEKLYRQYGESVPVHASDQFVRAMLLFEPDEVEAAINELPEQVERGIQWRWRAKLAILPALVATDDRFLQALVPPSLVAIDDRILNGWQPPEQ